MAHRIHSYLPALILAFWATASAQPGRLDFLKAHDSSFALLVLYSRIWRRCWLRLPVVSHGRCATVVGLRPVGPTTAGFCMRKTGHRVTVAGPDVSR